MKRSHTTTKYKSRSLPRSASTGLIDFLKKKYDNAIPVAVLTTTHKLYGRCPGSKILNKDDRFVQRFSDRKGVVNANKLIEYLSKFEAPVKGKGLSEDALRRVYGNCSNQDNKLTFEYIMKMGEQCGVAIDQKMAKAMVRKYGNRKDYLSIEDCIKINNRRLEAAAPKRKRI